MIKSRLDLTSSHARLLLGTAAFTLLAGCNDPEFLDELAQDFPEVVENNGDALTKPPTWGECPEGLESECATLEVPTQWLDPAGSTIEITISRRPATAPGGSKGHLWLLDGGPGGDAAGLSAAVDGRFPGAFADYDLYVMQHRGTGDSTRLTCPVEEDPASEGGVTVTESELPACLAELEATWGEGLNGFRLTNAARDLSYAIMQTSKPNDRVFVYGLSYGTLLAQRFMQISPKLADGVILDSVLPTYGASYFTYDMQSDPVGEGIADLCGADAFCASKLGENPWARVTELMGKLDAGHCSDLGLGSNDLGALGTFLITSDQLRRHFLPLVYRIDRCDPSDVAVVGNYLNTIDMLLGPPPAEIPGYSDLLFLHIAFSDINDNPGGEVPSFESLLDRCVDANLCGFYSVSARSLYDTWPTYPEDAYFREPLDVKTPILAMNGTLDPQTPLAMASIIKPALKNKNQTFVTVPDSPHVVLFRAPVNTPDQPSCGAQMIHSFIDAPKKRVDTSCLADLRLLDFDVVEPEAAFFFGTPDEWENAGDGGYALYPRVNVASLRAKIDVRRPWKLDQKLAKITADLR
jgi:pimeloyl-ACP methyl ester carboxylesterase